MTSPVPVADPGLQPERTSMAWGRTSLAFMVAAAVLLRMTPHYGPAVACVAGGLLVVALGILTTQKRRYRRAATGVSGAVLSPSTGAVLGLSACTVLLGVAGMVFVLLP